MDIQDLNSTVANSNQPLNTLQVLELIFIIILLVTLAGIVGYSFGVKKTFVKSSVPTQLQQCISVTPTQSGQQSSDTINAIPYWSDPSGFYHIYSTCDQSSNCSIFVITRDINPKITKVLTVNNFHGEFGDVLWAKTNNLNTSEFILKVVGPGDGHVYYLLHVDGSPAIKLYLESGLSSYDEIISWVDESRILIKHTAVNTNLTNPQNITTTSIYEIASVNNLSQKKIISL